MSLFSILHKEASAIMIFHRDALQVLSFEEGSRGYKLIGYNEVKLDPGVIQGDKITDMDLFMEELQDLFQNADPNPIKAKKLFVNIPHHMLFSFVDDFSHRAKEESFKKAMQDLIREHSPVPLDELAVCFDSAERSHIISYAAYAAPKHWEDRLLQACQPAGVDVIEFVPEPLAYMSFLKGKEPEDCILVACHRSGVSFSVFRNGLIYDSYQVASCDQEGKPDLTKLLGEFEKAEKDFLDHFESNFESIYFIGFDKTYKDMIEESFKEKNIASEFVDTMDSELSTLLPYESSQLILFGLFNYVTSR